MVLFDLFRNYINALIGNNQEFEQLLAAKDITRVKEKMVSKEDDVLRALKEYDISEHDVMRRKDKIITDKKGKFVRMEKVWKIPIPYQKYINEIALVFLYGRPVKWIQNSDGTDNAFAKYQDLIKSTHFNAKIRECKRLAGRETQSALLFRVYKEDDGTPNVQLRVLARSKGDEIYTRKDIYGNILAMAWGYYTKGVGDRLDYHFDVYTRQMIYHCTKAAIGWEVVTEANLIGKIPFILFEQRVEWDGVQHLIERKENIGSRTADTNDYFADPMAIMDADIIKNMPDKKEAAKLLITNSKDGVDHAAKYLTWDSAPESKKNEAEELNKLIFQMSFTPEITLDSMEKISQLSAKALRTVMLLAVIKANKNRETHDELLDRTASLFLAIIGNVLDVSLHDECENCIIEHEFQEPLGDDITETLQNITTSVDAGIMSTDTAVSMNPLIKDPQKELEKIQKESEEKARQQQMLFAGGDDGGAQSYFDGDEGDDTDPNKKNAK